MAMSAAGHKKETNFKPRSIVVKGRRPWNIKHKPSSARKQVCAVLLPGERRSSRTQSIALPFLSFFPLSFFHTLFLLLFLFFLLLLLLFSVCLSLSSNSKWSDHPRRRFTDCSYNKQRDRLNCHSESLASKRRGAGGVTLWLSVDDVSCISRGDDKHY